MRKKRDPIFRVKPGPDFFTLFEVSIQRKKLRWDHLSIKEIHDRWLQCSGDNLKLSEDDLNPSEDGFIFFEDNFLFFGHHFNPFGYRFSHFCNNFNLSCDNFDLFCDNFKLFCDHFNLCFEDFNQPYFAFYLSVMVIMMADPIQRRAIRRKTARGARNIPFKQQRVQSYLRIAMGTASKMRMLNRIFETAFTDLKEELGFPKKNGYEFCWDLKDQIFVKASPKCRKYLETRRGPNKFLYEEQFRVIKQELKAKFPDDAAVIIELINKTKSKDHLSAISINTEYGETYVHIVSPHNKQIKMEAWKFMKLLEDPEKPKLLYDFEALDSRKYNHKFIFNTRTDGRVEGAFYKDDSTLRCIRFEQRKNNQGEQAFTKLGEPIESANFMLDTYYIFCLYTMLKRLEEDKIKFDELRKKADVAVSNEDHFRRIALIDL